MTSASSDCLWEVEEVQAGRAWGGWTHASPHGRALSRITCVPESLPSELYKQSRFTSVSVNGVLHITVALHLESYILGIRH